MRLRRHNDVEAPIAYHADSYFSPVVIRKKLSLGRVKVSDCIVTDYGLLAIGRSWTLACRALIDTVDSAVLDL